MGWGPPYSPSTLAAHHRLHRCRVVALHLHREDELSQQLLPLALPLLKHLDPLKHPGLEGHFGHPHLELCDSEVALEKLNDALELLAHPSGELVGEHDVQEFADGAGEGAAAGKGRLGSTGAGCLAPGPIFPGLTELRGRDKIVHLQSLEPGSRAARRSSQSPRSCAPPARRTPSRAPLPRRSDRAPWPPPPSSLIRRKGRRRDPPLASRPRGRGVPGAAVFEWDDIRAASRASGRSGCARRWTSVR